MSFVRVSPRHSLARENFFLSQHLFPFSVLLLSFLWLLPFWLAIRLPIIRLPIEIRTWRRKGTQLLSSPKIEKFVWKRGTLALNAPLLSIPFHSFLTVSVQSFLSKGILCCTVERFMSVVVVDFIKDDENVNSQPRSNLIWHERALLECYCGCEDGKGLAWWSSYHQTTVERSTVTMAIAQCMLFSWIDIKYLFHSIELLHPTQVVNGRAEGRAVNISRSVVIWVSVFHNALTISFVYNGNLFGEIPFILPAPPNPHHKYFMAMKNYYWWVCCGVITTRSTNRGLVRCRAREKALSKRHRKSTLKKHCSDSLFILSKRTDMTMTKQFECELDSFHILFEWRESDRIRGVN